ncbi:glycosyltransferase family 9 protein [Pigmentibacter sp. JX0631]|uniref:glycosyltransferase family 9 protein n=1 Tax=Pigmentibacter sp. JX0631 TaxID=2976982 RepID=UPI0024683D79|nr:glycosyltransferase family 9 protein [Pigmentibacter sp. JX0631]WGL61205.1 glycosyltransferase family 9 protein [Pigmentibacter sp. JX0631]
MDETKLIRNVVISRTDNIGDVVLTLPLAGILKEYIPEVKIFFLGKKYTEPIISASKHIDHFLNWDLLKDSKNLASEFNKNKIDTIFHVFPNREIAKAAFTAKVKNRIGTNRRIFHWLYCNKKVNLTRKNSQLHESQLNTILLSPINITKAFSLSDLSSYYGLSKFKSLNRNFINLIDSSKFNLILHPKSKGSAREWSKKNFIDLANSLSGKEYQIFFSGSKEEQPFIENEIIPYCNSSKSIAGIFDLPEFISFINLCDGLIANSTGPLHIASALGKKTIGLYPPIKSMTPQRWAPVGFNANFIVGKSSIENQNCQNPCLVTQNCVCMNSILPKNVIDIISTWRKNLE